MEYVFIIYLFKVINIDIALFNLVKEKIVWLRPNLELDGGIRKFEQ